MMESVLLSEPRNRRKLALDRLRSLVPANTELQPGSAAALLRVMLEPPIPGSSDVDELDAAIAAGRLPVRAIDLF